MSRPSVLGAAALCLLVGLAACGGNQEESEEDIKAQLVESYQDGAGYSDEQAGCYADIVIDEIGIERLRDVDLAAEAPTGALRDDISAAAIRAEDECDLPSSSG
jgi:hypothetical protein